MFSHPSAARESLVDELLPGLAAYVIGLDVAHRLAPAQLRKVFDARHDEIVRSGLPADWSEFRKGYAAIRKAGHYVSIGELEPQLAAVAAPILKADGGAWAAISLVLPSRFSRKTSTT